MRIAHLVLLAVLAAGLAALPLAVRPVKAETLVVPDHYPTIQAAITAAQDGDTVLVRAGPYYEHVLIDKALSLVGEGSNATVIDGNLTGDVVQITHDHVSIRGFTIQRSGRAFSNAGIALRSVDRCNISGNRIVDNESGIFGAPTNTSIAANIVEDNYVGVALEAGATANVVARNQLVANTVSVHLYYADANRVIQNTMMNNWRGVTFWYSANNWLYHNNFLNNTERIRVFPHVNFLDNGREGNFWSDYNGTDGNHDGVGDVPYTIDGTNQDHYPLMGRFHSLTTTPRDEVHVVSNSTVTHMAYNQSQGALTVVVSNTTPTQTHGFCRVTLPTAVIPPPHAVIINDGQTAVLYLNTTLHNNGTHVWMYFAYAHSTHIIEIIPDLPAIVVLPLFTALTMLALALQKAKNGSSASRGAGALAARFGLAPSHVSRREERHRYVARGAPVPGECL